jgi:hypothetical protein
MYVAASAALTREILGKHKKDLLSTTLVIPAVGFVAKVYLTRHSHMDPAVATPLLGVLLLPALALLLCSYFAYVDLTGGRPSAGFPRHILVLPVPTWLLALVPMVTGSLFIAAFLLLWLRLTGIRFDWTEQLAIAGGVTASLCWIQALSWRLIQQRYVRLLTLAVVLTFAGMALISLLADDSHFLFGHSAGLLSLVCVIVSGYALAYLAVIRSRHGDTAESAASVRRLHVRTTPAWNRGTRLPRLRDGAAAQKWFEWRVFGRLLPTGMILFGSLVVLMMAFERIRTKPSVIELAMLAFLFLLIASLTGGAYASQSLETSRVELGLFRAALPLSDWELASSKLSLAIRSHLLSLLIVLVVIATVLLTSSNNTAVTLLWSKLQAVQGKAGASLCVFLLALAAAVTAWALAVYGMSAWLFAAAVNWKRNGWKTALIALLALALFLKLAALGFQARSEIGSWLESAHLTILLLPAVTLALGLGLLPRFRALNRLSDLRGAATVCGAALAACVVLLWQLDLSPGYRWALSWLAVTATLLTFIPFLLVPIVIGLHRHR